MKTLKRLIKILDGNWEKNQSTIIEHLNSDPGHDIGDAANAMEMLANVTGGWTFADNISLILSITEITGMPIKTVLWAMLEMAAMDNLSYDELSKELYP